MTTVNGLPAHILLVHAVIVLVPLTALAVVLVAFWPWARQRLTEATAALAVVTLVSVPVTTDAGEWLEHRVPRTALVRAHTELGDYMLPWAAGLALVAVAFLARALLARRGTRATVAAGGGPGTARTTARDTTAATAAPLPGGRVASIVLAVLAVVVAVGSVATVYRIGESGSRAVWTGQFSEQAQFGPGGPPPDGG